MLNLQKIGVFTSGGDSPGMNAAIRAVTRAALAYNLQVYGFIRGYNGLVDNDYVQLHAQSVSNIIQRGGTILKTARSKSFVTEEGRQKAFENLRQLGIDALVAIGGDGTFRGASVFYDTFGIPTIGIPGTIDNDLNGTDFTLGYDTAINTAIEAIDKIRDTADSHDRIFFVEVMGRDSGYIAVDVGIAAGAEAILVPETPTDMQHVLELLESGWKRKKTSMIVIVAEGDDFGNAQSVAQIVKEKFPQFDCRVSVLGHIQRGGSPSARDRVLGSRLGVAAVDALLAGKKNCMVGIINDQITLTDFKTSFANQKAINASTLAISELLGK